MSEKEKLLESWKKEEAAAQIHGWGFSHIAGRYREERLPWDYREEIKRYLGPEKRVLDIDTGGGEFFLSLGHPPMLCAAMEGYPPNVRLCENVLLPLGVDFRAGKASEEYPFESSRFDLVLNRHGGLNPQETYRVLKPGGLFITQQVGAQNDRDLAELLFSPAPPAPFPEQTLALQKEKWEAAGFRLIKGREAFRFVEFQDVGALVWFAGVLPWEFPGFSVQSCRDGLWKAQALLEKDGMIRGRIHRFLLVLAKV